MDIMPLTLSCPLTRVRVGPLHQAEIRTRRIYPIPVPAAAFFCMHAILNGEDYCL